MKDLSHYRKSYDKRELLESTIPDNPILLFDDWFHEFEDSAENHEPNAMTMSTIGLDGFPKSRVVLLKGYSKEGFVFYTNYDSEKGQSIAANPSVCLSFFWHEMERQVIIKGHAQKISENASNAYFDSRPKLSQLSAIVSPQSEIIPSRDFLEKNTNELAMRFKERLIPRPNYWGGYLVVPLEIEFWQGRPNRLHDRIRYQRQFDDVWKTERLAP